MFFRSPNLSKEDQWQENLSNTLRFLRAWLIGGSTVLLLCAISFYLKSPTRDGAAKFLEILCHGAFLSLAFGSMGSLVGFLFGIPRQTRQSNLDKNDSSHDKPTEDAGRHADPTNLEQVSDWLTKVILGAGLSQLSKLPGALNLIGNRFSEGLDGNALLPILIVMYSLVFGFFAGYLLTQLFLAQALQRAEDAAKSVTEVLNTVGNLEKLEKTSAATATLEAAVSNLPKGTPTQSKRELFERLTYNALYELPSGGFQKAIRYAEQ
jgi:hypothetical protein